MLRDAYSDRFKWLDENATKVGSRRGWVELERELENLTGMMKRLEHEGY
jgi:hypothetical protein